MDKETRTLIKEALAQGWRVEELKAGYLLKAPPPSDEMVVIHGTPSDTRAYANTLARMRRAGLLWPPSNRGRSKEG
ncbi:MAG TPA: hypothetical protein VI541_05365 [Actinomycetota bacterium]|nr:hypothetical protein [Actinomycetota bacterium]